MNYFDLVSRTMEDVGQFSMKFGNSNNSPSPVVEPLLSRFSAAHRNISFAAAAALAKANYIEKSSKNLFDNVSDKPKEDEVSML
jgi:hypothetical protein